MNKIKVKIKKLKSQAAIPTYATAASAAADLRSAADEAITLKPGERKIIPTGIAIAPESREVVALVCARSGLATKQGLTLANGVGVIDSDYRGEIGVAMINLGNSDCTIEPGDRIAQLMFMPVCPADFEVADELDETDRGTGGFGSTGKK